MNRVIITRWLVGLAILIGFGNTFGKEKIDKKKIQVSSVERPAIQKKKSIQETTIIDIYGSVPTISQENQRKRAVCKEFVEKIVAQMAIRPLKEVFEAVTWSEEYKKGEIYAYIWGTDGTEYAHGDMSRLLWGNVRKLKDDYGAYRVNWLLDAVARHGLTSGAWYTYRWGGLAKSVYARLVEREGIQYVVGAGYFPYNKADLVVSFVKGAAAIFQDEIEQGFDIDAILGFFNRPTGDFLMGDLYIKIMNEKGDLLVYGLRPKKVGSHVWDVKDSHGVYYDREIIKVLKEKPVGSGFWIDYIDRNVPKKTYAERVVDKQGNSYFIASGFYTGEKGELTIEQERQRVIDLVKKGAAFAQVRPIAESAQAFWQDTPYLGNKKDLFVYGDLFLFVVDDEGIDLADGRDPGDVGSSYWNATDQGGTFFVQEIIKKAQKDGSGWLTFNRKNAFWEVYFQRIHVENKPMVIGCGFYPISKNNTLELLVRSAVTHIKSRGDFQAFNSFCDPTGIFVRGDLAVTVFDTDGFCYAHGPKREYLWKNLKEEKDDTGVLWVQELIEQTKKGLHSLQTLQRKDKKVYYAERVALQNKQYVVCSGYYP
jgi:hypothetical protein